MAKQKQRSKTASANFKDVRTSVGQALKKRSKAPKRISSSRAADVTAEINSQFAQVQSLYTIVRICAVY